MKVYKAKLDPKTQELIDPFFRYEGYPPLMLGCMQEFSRKCWCGSHVSFNETKGELIQFKHEWKFPQVDNYYKWNGHIAKSITVWYSTAEWKTFDIYNGRSPLTLC